MNPDPHGIDAGWADRLVSRWLDSDFQPSTHAVRGNAWSALVVADTLNWMETEWLAEAIASTSSGTVRGVGLEHRSKPEVFAVASLRDAIMEFNFRNSWRYAMPTSTDAAYIYYKDEANRFYLLCGPPDFLALAYRCSRDTARRMFFDYWIDLEHRSDGEKRFLQGVWEKYGDLQQI